MERTTIRDLEQAVTVINSKTGDDYSLGRAYGKKRLVKNRESQNVSPLLPTGQLYMWLMAFIEGLDAAIYGRS